ncbi:MAG: ISL3 family transposase, partial [Cyanobacteria bacterium P01_G01_bin.4]
MEFLQHLLPSQVNVSLTSWSIDCAKQQLVINLSSTQTVACCPVCQTPSHRIHSGYERTLRDLPLVQFSLLILLQVCKFFCFYDSCARRIFTERLPQIVAPWARRTTRYTAQLEAMGLALGGVAAARLSFQLGYGYSRNTILRAISKLSLPVTTTPEILGVDDFAFGKGHQYGTILVDLGTHQPIALLPDRTAGTLASWLKEHPGVKILSRDRSKAYRRGMSDGAPDAIQVADRFHLLQNLEEALEKVFQGQIQQLKQVEQQQIQAKQASEPLTPKAPPDRERAQREAKRAIRLERWEQTHALRKQGYAIKDIAHHLGIGKRTVYTYLAASTFPEWQYPGKRRKRPSCLDPYKAYLSEQWQQGRQHTKELFNEIQQQGYPGSYMTVTVYTRQLRRSLPSSKPSRESLNDFPGRGPAPSVGTPVSKPLRARRAAWLVLTRPENLTPEEKSLLETLGQPNMLTMSTLATITTISSNNNTNLDS